MEFIIHDISTPVSDTEFERIYYLLSSSLPQTEMRTKSGQKRLLSDARYKLITAEESGEIIGFMAIWELDGFCFAEHFAVDSTRRLCGVGTKLLRFVQDAFSPIILEVELPGSTPEASRRIGFYERNGFIYNDYEYYQPAMQDGFELLPLRIMSAPKPLTLSEFEDVKSTLYNEIYTIL